MRGGGREFGFVQVFIGKVLCRECAEECTLCRGQIICRRDVSGGVTGTNVRLLTFYDYMQATL